MSCALTVDKRRFWRRKAEKRNTERANNNTLELHTEPRAADAVKTWSAGLSQDEKRASLADGGTTRRSPALLSADSPLVESRRPRLYPKAVCDEVTSHRTLKRRVSEDTAGADVRGFYNSV